MGVTFVMCRQPTFWFTMALVPVILLFPTLGKRSLSMDIVPTLTDRVRLLQRKETQEAKKAKGKGNVELKNIRKYPTVGSRVGSGRPGSRLGSGKSRPGSVRSGYAFAHQEGFGEMITSGRSMRIKDPPEKNGKAGGIKKSKSKQDIVEEKKENGGGKNEALYENGVVPTVTTDEAIYENGGGENGVTTDEAINEILA